ncbi:hypothetical protein LSH36_12g11007 [Paralvinella palmiformis]|uniref:Uncharacterized protein n=1 Tax=Paralvinella palmiformis TaxID=53620 RepID=A0AAD9KD24_9ANNE|nr:hypothetical protein LSH36_12g11007 [Paralvinella palmiformis]
MSPEQGDWRDVNCPKTGPRTTSVSASSKCGESISELYTSKALKDLSVISQQSGAETHEQASSANLSGAFHSTLNYPLHSTLNYPLHSTFSEQNDFIPKSAARSKNLARSKYISDTILEDTEGESSSLSDEFSIDVDEYAANWEAVKMKRQKGQAALSGNRMLPKYDHHMNGTASSSSTSGNCPAEITSARRSPVGQSAQINKDNESTLTNVTYVSLHDVWNSPNNTLKNTQDVLPEMETPTNTHVSLVTSHSRHQKRVDHHHSTTSTVSANKDSPSYEMKTSRRSYSREMCTPRMLKRTHYQDASSHRHSNSRSRKSTCPPTPCRYSELTSDNESADSGLSTSDSPSGNRQLTICDNTGRCRSIALAESGHKHSITAEHKKIVAERLRSFSSSCASHSVLLML